MFTSVAVFALSVVIASGMFFDYKKILLLRWKLLFVILIILGNIAFLMQSRTKEKIEERRWDSAQSREDIRTQDISRAIREPKEEKRNNILDNNYLNTPTGFLDNNYLRLKDIMGTNKKIDEQYLAIYFTEVSKIPEFYTWEEWKETENILFKNMQESLKGYFIQRNNYDGHGKTIEDEFVKERAKYIKAKERESNKEK